MSTKLLPATLVAALLSGTALADVPAVAVDIAPVHSLVARVMAGVGQPDLIVPPGASPHEYNLRPSEAAALQKADLVFWMGADLTPWLEGAIATLARGADVTTLLDRDETAVLAFRHGASFEDHDHGDGAHEDHDEGPDDHAGTGPDGHSHEGRDPHAWLSPDNASAWLNVIAAQLSGTDPDNAGAYAANAAAGRAEIAALRDEISAVLDPVRGNAFVVFHDAYQYFEVAFDFPASGAISLSDATDPSPARIAEIRDRVRNDGIACVLAEPQFNPRIVSVVVDGTKANTAVLDPLGSDLGPGPEMYPQLLRTLANVLADCL